MKETALAGGHGCEGEGLAGVADLLDGDLGGQLQLALAEDFEVVGVEGYTVMLFVLEAEDLGSDVFEGEEKLAVASEQQRCVRAAELDADFGGRGCGGAA